jgi:erythromycin esterase-like protein
MKKDITLVAIDFKYHELTRQGIERSIATVDPKEVIVVSDKTSCLVQLGFQPNQYQAWKSMHNSC